MGRIGLRLGAALAVAASCAARAQEPGPACELRAQAHAADLLACIRGPDLQRHLVAFQNIADANPDAAGHGNRDTGAPGYRASVDYVAAKMRAAGYRVTIQPYLYRGASLVGPPVFATDRKALALGADFHMAVNSGSGEATGPVAPPGGAASGCATEDFRNFPAGAIALIQRGDCEPDEAVANAVAAGAAAVAIYNAPASADGEAKRRRHRDGAAYPFALKAPASVPVFAMLSNAAGAELARRSAAGEAARARLVAQTQVKTDYNLIADSPFGDPDHVVVVDAHLDSIFGAGILDNASGSATILEIALKLQHTPTRNRLRYIWFGGEEINLLGSAYYTKALPAADLRKIAYDIDVDVTATPNYDYLIADPGKAPNVKKFPPGVVAKSAPANAAFFAYFAAAGVPARAASFGNDGTDSNSFSLVGVPNSGILTQQDCCKAAWEVKIWGGERGNYEGHIPSFDGGCVDQPREWCDNLANTRLPVMVTASKAAASVVYRLANAPLNAQAQE